MASRGGVPKGGRWGGGRARGHQRAAAGGADVLYVYERERDGARGYRVGFGCPIRVGDDAQGGVGASCVAGAAD